MKRCNVGPNSRWDRSAGPRTTDHNRTHDDAFWPAVVREPSSACMRRYNEGKASMIIWRYYRAAHGQLNAVAATAMASGLGLRTQWKEKPPDGLSVRRREVGYAHEILLWIWLASMRLEIRPSWKRKTAGRSPSGGGSFGFLVTPQLLPWVWLASIPSTVKKSRRTSDQPAQRKHIGNIMSQAILGGLHHRYVRI